MKKKKFKWFLNDLLLDLGPGAIEWNNHQETQEQVALEPIEKILIHLYMLYLTIYKQSSAGRFYTI